ncbi:DUF6008 family protein [Bradyrhizobium sp. SZCCHNR3015]|uniref:DUF6008 family protein n=1 Tax=Bradyrhizobium sp. SZCCHNR3015 TaxID=3057395 RepID=UPI002916ED5C|nr:DUF6008 family protein [Bradyrhizobium sp. SZCCHNR3015]
MAAERVFDTSTPGPMLDLVTVMAAIAGVGLAFQVGHFAEHALQFAVWILGDYSNICGRDTPWMSSWVTEMVRQAGTMMFPAADARRQMMMGMEVLHLIGNGIFLISLGCLYHSVRSKWVRWAFYIEGFHLYEHLMLTLTAYFVGKPIGLSTLFGGSDIIGSREFAVGYRVTWHFAMNLLPMPFAMIGLIEHMGRKARPAHETSYL